MFLFLDIFGLLSSLSFFWCALILGIEWQKLEKLGKDKNSKNSAIEKASPGCRWGDPGHLLVAL